MSGGSAKDSGRPQAPGAAETDESLTAAEHRSQTRRTNGRSSLSPLFTWRSAIADSDLRPTLRHVALTLSLHMNERGGSCFPAMETLARETGLGKSTARKSIAELEERGWLLREIRRGRNRTNLYTATIPEPDDGKPPAAGDLKPPARARKTASSSTENRQPGGAKDVKRTSVEDDAGKPAPAPTVDQRNAAWDALDELFGKAAPHEQSRRGRISRDLAIAMIVDHGADVEPDRISAEIRRRAAAYRRAWPSVAFTDTALYNRWSVFAPATEAATSPRERAKRWIDANGWKIPGGDAREILIDIGLGGDQLERALLYRDTVAREHQTATEEET